MDTLIRGGVIVTCDEQHRVLAGDLAIQGNTLVGIGADAASELMAPYHVVEAGGCVVMPGIVQAHVHLVHTLFRGLADGVPLLSWLRTFILPLEAAHDEASLTLSAELGAAELLLGGTTTILDMGTAHGHDAVFEALARAGLRAVSGKVMMDLGVDAPKRLRETARESLRESERLAKAWSGAADGRLGYAYCPRFVLSCSDKLLRDCGEAAAASGALVHTHAAEQEEERALVRDQRGADDVALLARFGITGSTPSWRTAYSCATRRCSTSPPPGRASSTARARTSSSAPASRACTRCARRGSWSGSGPRRRVQQQPRRLDSRCGSLLSWPRSGPGRQASRRATCSAWRLSTAPGSSGKAGGLGASRSASAPMSSSWR